MQSSSFVFEFAHFDRLECLDCNSNLQYFFVDCAAILFGLNQTSMFKLRPDHFLGSFSAGIGQHGY